MKIGLAAVDFRNNDINYNLNQIGRVMRQAKQAGCQLVCFGETFLQGFDAFTWDYAHDKTVGLTRQSDAFQLISKLSYELGIDIALGYLEREDETLYCSYAVIEYGQVIHNYRRISRGWKEFSQTDEHYQEGDQVIPFEYRGRRVVIAICGDLWDFPERFHLDQAITLWPNYIDYTAEDWRKEKPDYAAQTAGLPGDVLLINSHTPGGAIGGAFHFRAGQIVAELPPGQTGLLEVSL